MGGNGRRHRSRVDLRVIGRSVGGRVDGGVGRCRVHRGAGAASSRRAARMSIGAAASRRAILRSRRLRVLGRGGRRCARRRRRRLPARARTSARAGEAERSSMTLRQARASTGGRAHEAAGYHTRLRGSACPRGWAGERLPRLAAVCHCSAIQPVVPRYGTSSLAARTRAPSNAATAIDKAIDVLFHLHQQAQAAGRERDRPRARAAQEQRAPPARRAVPARAGRARRARAATSPARR